MTAFPKERSYRIAWGLLLVFPLIFIGTDVEGKTDTDPCSVAREIAVKGVFLFEHQADQGLAALEKAQKTCPDELGILFNLGLAHYLSGHLEQAGVLWESLHAAAPDHEKALANLAWVKFEMGKDREAKNLASKGLESYPKSWALAHTKAFSLFRMGRYLEAYDWLNHSGLSGIRATQWKQKAAEYVVETQWKKFRKNGQMKAIQQAVNLLVKWYPGEALFIDAKDRLLLAHLDKNADIPYPIDLPHESWKKTGNIDDQSVILDEHIKVLPSLVGWEKRVDAFALIVGISHYKRLKARHFAERDARNMQQLLVSRGPFINDVDHVRLRTNQAATKKTLESDLQWLLRQGQLNPNALLIFYFSGLGVPWPINQSMMLEDALLIPVEAQMGEVRPETTLSLAKLKAAIKALPNQDVIVILDTCFNGKAACALQGAGTHQALPETRGEHAEERQFAVAAVPIQTFFDNRRPWVLAALQKDATLHSPGRQGSLTYFLLEGMLGKGDGADGSRLDGWVDLAEAFAFARKNIPPEKSDIFLSQPAKIRLTKTVGER